MMSNVRHCRILKNLLGALFSLVSATLQAAPQDIEFAGFASFVYAKGLDGDEGTIATPAGDIINEGEYRDFGKLGLRMDAVLVDEIRFAAQMVAYGNKDYEPDFDWIYTRFHLTPEVRLDVGKTRVPLYMYSDFIDVSYAYQWLVPPTSVYGRSFFRTLEGGKISYLTGFGEWSSDLQLFTGKTEESFSATSMDFTVGVDDVKGVAWTVDREWLALRLIYAELDITLDGFTAVDDLLGGLALIEAGINVNAPLLSLPLLDTRILKEDLLLRDDRNQYTGLGVTLRFDPVFIASEVTQSRFDDNLATGNKSAGYLMLGTKLPGRWSLSVTCSVSDQEPNAAIVRRVNRMTAPYMGTPLEPAAQMVRDSVDGAVAQAQDLKTTQYILGARWDFHPAASLKLEYVQEDDDGVLFDTATFTKDDTSRNPQAYLLGLDLVF